MEPTHDSYEAAVREALASEVPIGKVVLRAGTDLEVYQVWDDFRLASPEGFFDIWRGTPPRFVPSPLARRPFASISDLLNETPHELVRAYQMQADCLLELITEEEANTFEFDPSGIVYSDLLLFGPEEAKESFGEWMRGLVFDRVHKHVESENFDAAYDLISAFHNRAPTSS